MLNFVSEKKLEKASRRVGLLGFPNSIDSIMELLQGIPHTTLSGVFASQIEKEQFSQSFTNNPFGLISQSDIIIANKTDKQSLNLIVESFLNSKHVLLVNPFSLEIDELNALEKLCIEGRNHLIACNSFTNWEIIESLSNFGRQTQHLELSVNTGMISDSNSLKQKVFEIIYLLHILTKTSIKKILMTQVPSLNHKIGSLKMWVEFENSCVSTVLLNTAAFQEEILLKLFQKDQIVDCNMHERKIIIGKINHQQDIISLNSNSTFIQYVFEKLMQADSQDWFEHQLNTYRKSLLAFHKLVFKFPSNKK